MTESKKLSSKKRTKNPPKFVLKKPLQPNSTDIFVCLINNYKKRYEEIFSTKAVYIRKILTTDFLSFYNFNVKKESVT